MSQEPKKLSDPLSNCTSEDVSKTTEPTHQPPEVHSVPRLHSPVPKAHSPMPRTRLPMPRIHSPLSSTSSPSASAPVALAASASASRTAQRPPVPRIRTGSVPSDSCPVTPMGFGGSREGSVDSAIMTPASPDVVLPLGNSRPHVQTTSKVTRSLSREEIINRMEFEQDALVVRLLKEINDLKQENAKLRYQIRKLQRSSSLENLGSSAATAVPGSGNNYPQYLHVGPSSEESVAVLDDTDRRGSIAAATAATTTSPATPLGGPHIARSIQATFGIPHGYPKKADPFTPASSAAVARRRSSVSHGSIYPLDVHRIGNQNSSVVSTGTGTGAAVTAVTGSTYPSLGEHYNYAAQRKSTRSSSVHTMESVGRYSLAAAGRDTSAARSQR